MERRITFQQTIQNWKRVQSFSITYAPGHEWTRVGIKKKLLPNFLCLTRSRNELGRWENERHIVMFEFVSIAIFHVTSRALLGIVFREPVVGKKRDKQLKICVFESTVASLLCKISFSNFAKSLILRMCSS